ncbi:MAG: CFI-box-CTERM domain-containing protein, partial [Candidatus Bathyarchaeia archaeon]
PDIAVERVYFEPGVVSANETVTLKADVANRGSQAASAYKIDCHVNGELYHTFSISLAVGASTTIAVDWQAKSGLNKIRFSLNRSGGYPDSNPGNDVLEADLVVGYSIIIEVPANVPVKVNGTDRYPDDSGKVRIGALEGELMLELPEAVLLSGDTRLSFSRWSDGEKTNLRQIYVTQDLSLAAEYSKQYLLSLDPGGGEVAGAGWYDEGSEATAQAVTPSKVIEGRSRLRFTQWMGDMNSTSSTLTLTMDRPKRLKAGWQTQYYLAINSPFGPVSGSGWYDEQATATFTLGSATAENAGVRASFLGWNGDYTGSDTSAALTMNGPKNVEAVWRVEYQLTVISDHGHPSGSGWYQTGSEATIRVEETVGEAEGVRLVFTGWSGDVTSSQAEATIKVEKPMTVKAAWKTQYKVKFSAVGLPQGATFNFTLNGQERPITAPFAESYWYDAGSTISFNATYRIPVKLGFYLLDHWEDQEGNKVLGPCEVDKPLTLSAIYKQGFGCIIATATYGSELSPQVSFLRTFRDTQVLSSFAGYCFMSVFNRWYYSFSPTVADQITLHESVKPIIRAALAPLLWILQASARVYALTPGDPEASVVVSGIVASALIGAVHLSPMLISSSLIFSRASRRLGRLYRKAAGSLALLAAASLAGVYVAELTRFYPMMELATASLVLSTIFLSVSLTNRLFMKLSSTRLHKRAIRWMGLER